MVKPFRAVQVLAHRRVQDKHVLARHDQCAEAHALRAVLHGLQGPAQTEYQALAQLLPLAVQRQIEFLSRRQKR